MKAKDVRRGTKFQVSERQNETVAGDAVVTRVEKFVSGALVFTYEVTVVRTTVAFAPYDEVDRDGVVALS